MLVETLAVGSAASDRTPAGARATATKAAAKRAAPMSLRPNRVFISFTPFPWFHVSIFDGFVSEAVGQRLGRPHSLAFGMAQATFTSIALGRALASLATRTLSTSLNSAWTCFGSASHRDQD